MTDNLNGTAQARDAAAARFDELLAKDPLPDAETLREALELEVDALSERVSVGTRAADTSRLALLAGATRDYELWLRLVRYLTAEDSAHRLYQKLTGTPKEDLGPHASEERSAGWVRRRSRWGKAPEAARVQIEKVLEEYEKAFLERASSVGGQASGS